MSCVWGVGFTWSTSGQEGQEEEGSRDRNVSGNTRVADEGERGGGSRYEWVPGTGWEGDRILTLMSCFAFLRRSLSALMSSSMLSLMRFASASRWRRATRSSSVSDAGGRRSWEKGSASVFVLWTEGGREVVSIADAEGEGRGGKEEEGVLARGKGVRGAGEGGERKARRAYKVWLRREGR